MRILEWLDGKGSKRKDKRREERGESKGWDKRHKEDEM